MSLLTVTQVALLLSLKPKTVSQLIHDRQLQAINVTPKARGHHNARPTWRIDPVDLRSFQESHKQIPADVVRRRARTANVTGIIEFIK